MERDLAAMNSPRRLRAESSAARDRIRRLSELSSPGIWDWEIGSDHLVVTPRLREIFGFEAFDIVNLADLVAATYSDDRDWSEQFMSSESDLSVVKFRFRKRGGEDLRWAVARIWRTYQGSDVCGYSATVADITEEVEVANALTESEERLRLAIEAGKMAVWDVDLQSGEMTQSPELNLLCGYSTAKIVRLEDVRALYNPGEIERLAREGNTVEAVSERAVGGAFEPRKPGQRSAGTNRTQVQAEVAITTPSGLPKHLMLRAQYLISLSDRPKLTGLLIDVTDSKAAEEKLALVARELHHRVKNSLSVVQAIAMQTFRRREDVEGALGDFLGRLQALGAVNDMILAEDQSGADLREIIQKITSPYNAGPVQPFILDGPPARVGREQAASMGLVLHELCTNAVKYGALTIPGGEILVTWARAHPGTAVLTWTERNGPKVNPPTHRGFGSRLLEQAMSRSSTGKVTLDFHPDGLRCQIDLRLSDQPGD